MRPLERCVRARVQRSRGVALTLRGRITVDLYKPRLHDGDVEAFDVLGDPVRRRILEVLAAGERAAGEIAADVGAEFGISQPAVSQHLKVLRTHGFTTVRAEGTRRLYALDPTPLGEVEDWAAGLRTFWEQRLDALGTELVRARASGASPGVTRRPPRAAGQGRAAPRRRPPTRSRPPARGRRDGGQDEGPHRRAGGRAARGRERDAPGGRGARRDAVADVPRRRRGRVGRRDEP
ncbi:ArsR/SmtB family transcription factor [Cellulosimicrobium sp. CUA-896]|uniref:ArsR/SmtB family transcription factor n=1 Tax=Cellulosimicrobium sp. CUA-896 TaxID=1517881 RepID=UPI0035167981